MAAAWRGQGEGEGERGISAVSLKSFSPKDSYHGWLRLFLRVQRVEMFAGWAVLAKTQANVSLLVHKEISRGRDLVLFTQRICDPVLIFQNFPWDDVTKNRDFIGLKSVVHYQCFTSFIRAM